MNAYLEIRLLPDPEFTPTTLMNALFSKLHRGLVAHGEENIGVSFPDVTERERSLGARLRLHGSKADLEKFMSLNWIVGMRDHSTVSAIMEVPAHARPRRVRRVQAKSSVERLRRRLIAWKGISSEEAAQVIPDSKAKTLKLPYVILSSQSTGQQFRLFIEHLPVQEEAGSGSFGTYGFSQTATVPWF